MKNNTFPLWVWVVLLTCELLGGILTCLIFALTVGLTIGGPLGVAAGMLLMCALLWIVPRRFPNLARLTRFEK